MAGELEKQANEAFIDDQFERAVELFTQAIAADPTNASLLVSRSQGHIKLKNYTDAIADANKAIELHPSNLKAFLRKGIACFELEEYETAKAAFVAGAKMEPSSSIYQTWIKKCDDAIAAEDGSHLGGGHSIGSRNGELLNNAHETITPLCPSTSEAPSQHFKPVQKFRHTYYQSASEMVVEIFAKNLQPEEVKVDIGVQFLTVVIDSPPNELYTLQTRLNQKVVVEKCKHNIFNSKVEIRLAKAENVPWKTLDYNDNQLGVQTPIIKPVVVESKLEYPSSSRKGQKNWDKLEAQVKKEEKDEKLEGDAALNKLFRDIYKDADEDTRRAMNKSFVESNGTVLSTNWKDVDKKYVEGSPPSGMEMRKWEV